MTGQLLATARSGGHTCAHNAGYKRFTYIVVFLSGVRDYPGAEMLLQSHSGSKKAMTCVTAKADKTVHTCSFFAVALHSVRTVPCVFGARLVLQTAWVNPVADNTDCDCHQTSRYVHAVLLHTVTL
eukprot:m.1216591 g.1216591  ORF g.1216591 m.1216591 type:complete len:126 (-) comp24614_c0_seq7:3111-3488(-)